MADYISLNSMENILREAGAERVSLKAKQALSDYVEDHALEIAKKSLKLTKHAERQTVKKEDIDAAITL